VQKKTATH